MKSIICPVSNELINEKVVRFNALFVVLFIVSALILKAPILILFLVADFFLRGFTRTKISPIGFASSFLAQSLRLSSKNIDKAPKIFAARLGFVMTFVIALLFLVDFQVAGFILTGMLLFFATLEFAFGICAGCIIYSYLVFPFYK